MGLEVENDVQDLDAETETEVLETDAGESAEESGAAANDDDETAEDAAEVVVSIGDETPQAEEEDNRAPEWVRELRKANREKDRKIRELQEQIQSAKPAEKAVEVGAKPTLEGCDYDAERFETELEGWHNRKREADAQQRKRQETEQAAQAAWQAKLDAYGKAKNDLKVKDFEDAEAAAIEHLNVTQQGVILNGADNPALLVYALGKNPKKAKELAAIADPVKFAFAVAKLETQLKVTPRKSAPPPEKAVKGSAPISGTTDSTLDRLRAEAAKTGDMSKVIAYKRQKRA